MNRREFLKRAGAAGVGFWTSARFAPARGYPRNARLNVAVIGAAGMRGADNTQGVSSETLLAFCDVDEKNLARALAKYPRAVPYHDFRIMLEKEKSLDAIVISTPDHIHAPAGVMAMKLGKHVYSEKPLAHSVFEARTLAKLAAERKLATQLGTQIHAGSNYRRAVELIQAGAVGPVEEVHVWVGGAWTAGDLPKSYPPCPPHLHWDLWLGPAAERPYHPEYHPVNWRKWWNFGGGHLADMGCHWIDLAFWALKLRHPLTVEAQGPPAHPEGAPPWLVVTWTFPARESLPPVTLKWYHGDRKPPHATDGRLGDWKGNGVLFVGKKGMLLADYGNHRLLPAEDFKDYARPPKSIPESIGHHAEWVKACKDGSPTTCNFDYSGALSEAVLLGNVAYRTGKKLEWDAQALKAKNGPEADRFLRREYRKGWAL